MMKRKTLQAILIISIVLSFFGFVSLISVATYQSKYWSSGNAVVDLADKIIDSTVIVSTDTVDEKNKQEAARSGVIGHGTGFFIKVTDTHAWVLTNHHVIESYIKLGSDLLKIQVKAAGRPWTYDAELVGIDKLTDLAVLKIAKKDNEDWVSLKWGDTWENAIEYGQAVLTVGHGLGQYWSVSRGVITGKDRITNAPFNFMIQHDAMINQGHSGGPLVNNNGEVIGVNTLLLSPGKSWSGVSLAVVGWQAQRSIGQIMEKGFVTYPEYDFTIDLVTLEEAQKQDEFNKGDVKKRSYLKIAEVPKGGKAEKAGFKDNDIILKVGKNRAHHVVIWLENILGKRVNEVITITILRDFNQIVLLNYQLDRLDVKGLTPDVVPLSPK
jgi:putative serine protease PepD